MEKTKVVYLLRGLPGSGKSTLGEKLCGKCSIAADDYFMVGDEYRFDPTKLKEAHSYCQSRAKGLMADGVDFAVCNTFSQKWEMDPYYKLAERYGYHVVEIVVRSDFKNVHNVPESVLEAMKNRFEY